MNKRGGSPKFDEKRNTFTEEMDKKKCPKSGFGYRGRFLLF